MKKTSSEEILDRFRSQLTICDGATGTMLQAAGLGPGECPELWNFEHPDQVRAVHRGYVEAGADLVETNTFGGNGIKLAKYSLQDRGPELCRAGVKLAQEACEGRALVAASVGPLGELLQPLGDLPQEQAQAAFQEQVEAVAEAGADVIIVETMSDLEEAKLAIQAAKSTGLPVICSLAFEPNGKTMMGLDPAQGAVGLAEAGADVVGANCGTGPKEMVPVIEQMKQATDLPILAQPNAGQPELIEGKTVFRATPEEIAEYGAKFVTIGARLVGGCCGTTPDHIRALVRRLRN